MKAKAVLEECNRRPTNQRRRGQQCDRPRVRVRVRVSVSACAGACECVLVRVSRLAGVRHMDEKANVFFILACT